MSVVHETVAVNRTKPVTTYEITGITNTNIGKVHKVPAGATIKIVLTSAGTGSVYSTNDPRSDSDSDDTVAKIEGTGNTADWDEWGAGDVTASTVQVTTTPVETVACAPTSGTWTLQVSVGKGD